MAKPILSERVAYGFKGGPRFSTAKSSAVNQQERRKQNQTKARHYFAWTQQNADDDLIAELRAFWYDMRGDFRTWLLKDWTDYLLVGEEIGIGDGINAAFQITKTYTAGFNPYVRVIRYLKAGTLVVRVDGVVKTLTTHYTVSETGLITFTGGNIPAADKVVDVDGEFYVLVRFEGDAFEPSIPGGLADILNVDNLQAIEKVE
ncbi:DUF2460 domain-containing protein [Mesorhizobium sp. B2-4-6]|uniref:DUF2460 domain-containing protein n=1 Tax=Mesorhizobium sp. B2-4-6 TaxID=2589943 RepID=UPI00112A026E|nr:DUF2460 domain-containing protein [Mesorhizobium sp. B2-4-6]TPL40702.1 hypothetical protein FJ957_26080 [Mesorhizobium sp. B2-4-6]